MLLGKVAPLHYLHSYEVMVHTYQITLCHNPEDSKLNLHTAGQIQLM